MMRVYFILIVLLVIITQSAFGQSQNNERLLEIVKEQNELNLERKQRLSEYSDISESISLQNGNKEAILYDIFDGRPVYMINHNAQARKTTGVEDIQSNSGLNLQLYGEGISIGVWDGGLVRSTHSEFGTRINNISGSDISNHATHVTGTIAAKGINNEAKGMAPLSRIRSYYAFENDLGPMATEAANGLILSNHSYGLLLGWDFSNGDWKWFGGSGNKDLRFGYYSNKSKTLDDILYNAPFYTIVWSAGNDRSDVGDGTRPPDGPFDTIGPAAAAKNVLTVGAITGFNEYVDSQSAVMSNFSSWGPTDDGRIKPDIVADGVDLLSTSSSGDSSYVTLSGTSMSAPNVTGTLALIQEYNKNNSGEFLTSAELKSLIIHSAKEAGIAKGPDYIYGWGVLNAPDAINILSKLNGSDTTLFSSTLTNGSEEIYSLFSDGKTPIVATLSWVDPPAEPGDLGTNDIKLVHDLDILLKDDDGNVSRPWTLNPNQLQQGAVQGDNIRDNVEKIEFPNVLPRRYQIIVKHKGTLISPQTYALTITSNGLEDLNDDIYWVNGSGSFIDFNWSSKSGGEVDSGLNPSNKTLIFDNNNTILSVNDTIRVTGIKEVNNFLWYHEDAATLDLEGDTLYIKNSFYSSNSLLRVINGTLMFNESNPDLNLNFNGSNGLSILLKGESEYNINENVDVNSVIVDNNSFVKFNNVTAKIGSLLLKEGSTCNFDSSNINIFERITLDGSIDDQESRWIFNNIDILTKDSIKFHDVIINGTTDITGKLIASNLNVKSQLNITGQLNVDSLNLESNSVLRMNSIDPIIIDDYILLKEGSELYGFSLENPTELIINFRKSICYEGIKLENLILSTESVVSSGLNSDLQNVEGILSIKCQDVIFPDFDLSSQCANSIVSIINSSKGNIETYQWDFKFDSNDKELNEPIIFVDSIGESNITLSIENSEQSASYSKVFSFQENDLDEIKIVDTPEGLVATSVKNSYEWYLNGNLIPGQNERILKPFEDGVYRVSYESPGSSCVNRVSAGFEFFITSVIDNKRNSDILVYPNPADEILYLSSTGTSILKFRIVNISGIVVRDGKTSGSISEIDVSELSRGIYVVKIIDNKNIKHIKFYKK